MIIEIMAFALMCLNTFPPVGGVSTTHSPRNTILYSQLDCNNHCHLPFGAYAHVHDDTDPLNVTDMACTTPGIYLGPTGNSRGSYKFLSLERGRVIKRYQFTDIP